MPIQTRSIYDWQRGSVPDHTYEYRVIDPVTKGTYLLRTQRPKIPEQVEFHVRLALQENKRVRAGETTVLYAL
jgi:hypothetical protein